MRVVAILSTNYAGSTLLSFILGALPGCASGGEDHIVLPPWKERRNLMCTLCGRGKPCPVLTQEVIQSCAPDNHWDMLAQARGCDTYITSTKDYRTYQATMGLRPDRDVRFLMLYRPPEYYIASAMKHNKTTHRTRSAKAWAAINRESMSWVDAGGYPCCVVSFDEFTRNPEGQLKKICTYLELPYEPAAIKYWNFEHHQFSGNTGTHINCWGIDDHRSKSLLKRKAGKIDYYREHYRKIIPLSDQPPPFTPEEIRAIWDVPDVRDVFNELEKRSKDE